MSYSTIYDMRTGIAIIDGVKSQKVSDATITTAKWYAHQERHSVIVEDRGTQECYRVTPSGRIWRAPKWWLAPEWERV